MAKLLLSMKDIKLAFGLRTVLDIERFEVFDGERIALVGENGAGKSTLLKLILGELQPDSGQIQRMAPIAVIHQMDGAGESPDAFDPRLEAEFSVQQVRDGLSGGERTRRRITGALSAGRPLLLADEPTSDLDQQGVERLTRHLKAHEGALILISHDRQLLDELCTVTYELQDARLTRYSGNYTAYRQEKHNRREFQQFEYDQYRAEQTRLKKTIQNKKEQAAQVKLPSRMGNSEARLHKRAVSASQAGVHQERSALESRLRQLEVKQRPREDPNIRMRLGAFTPITSRVALEMRGMSMRFGQRVLLEEAELRLPVGTRTALIGPNGCGKTTLIRRIASGDPRIRLSPGIKIGLFGQDHQDSIDLQKTALENAMLGAVFPESDVRTVLARLNLRGDEVFKRASVLSGGERAKLSLAKLFVSDVNLLILDEPTNHLDIFTLESLENVLSDYAGTLLLVSHDRRFVSSVATRLVFFEDAKLRAFESTMDAYLKQLEQKPDERQREIDRVALEMRMAFLANRIAHPGKRDKPEQLEQEYQSLAAQLRQLGS